MGFNGDVPTLNVGNHVATLINNYLDSARFINCTPTNLDGLGMVSGIGFATLLAILQKFKKVGK